MRESVGGDGEEEGEEVGAPIGEVGGGGGRARERKEFFLRTK